ncbi:transposase, partial [bacterium]|nr:transposase [bacterium]
VTLDLDATDDPTHGRQQLSLFNGHYDRWCYLPLLAFATFNDESDQHLLAAVLRPGVC